MIKWLLNFFREKFDKRGDGYLGNPIHDINQVKRLGPRIPSQTVYYVHLSFIDNLSISRVLSSLKRDPESLRKDRDQDSE